MKYENNDEMIDVQIDVFELNEILIKFIFLVFKIYNK